MADTVRLATAVRVALLPAMEAHIARQITEAEVAGVLPAEAEVTSVVGAAADTLAAVEVGTPAAEVVVTPVAVAEATVEDTAKRADVEW